MELIISHINTDFDALSSMVAAKKIHPHARFAFPGAQEKKVRDFIADMYPIDHVRIKDIVPSELKSVTIVDTKSPGRLGPLAEVLKESNAKVYIYDHHEHATGDIKGDFEAIAPVGATATIFTEIFRERDIKPTPLEASILCLGIYEETGNMVYPSTTDRDLEAVAWLIRAGASLKIVSTYLRSSLSAMEINILNKLTMASKETIIGGLKVVTATASSDQYLGDAAHLAHRIMDIDYTDAAVILLEMEGKVLIVGRSRTPEMNIASVLEHFGGGGHPTAASATVKEAPLELLEEQILKTLKKSVKPGRFAMDVMTSPVVTIKPTATIKNAEQRMTRYEVNVLPVTSEDDQYIGIISREVVEKALYHGLRDSPVVELATTDAIIAERYTPVSEIEREMVEQNQRFIPVVENGRIKGAITRTDLLRAMYDANLRRIGLAKSPLGGKQFIEKNIASWLCASIPGGLCDMLRQAGELAEELGYNAYLVGGLLRDIVRLRDTSEVLQDVDIDIVIEGNGITFAKELAQRLNARVHIHERFHTAKVVADKFTLDIATSRTEYYESPAALPTVEMSSIKKDLYRRDFTINTLAVKINPKTFGRLVDFFGAQRDIKEHTIKVLHNLSFIEDPTRAFRAVRFAQRFGFRISRHTENLIRSALRMDLFDKLTGTRLYDEMELIFKESEPTHAIERLNHYGLLNVIHPHLEFDQNMEHMLIAVDATLSWFSLLFTDEKPREPVIYLSALLSPLDDEEKEKALMRLSVPPKIKEAVINSIRRARKVLRSMPLKDPALICEALNKLSLECILLAMALTKYDNRKKEVSKYLMEYRNVRPELDGDDLKELGLEPGPEYSQIFRELTNMRLRGEITSLDEELGHVKTKWTRK